MEEITLLMWAVGIASIFAVISLLYALRARKDYIKTMAKLEKMRKPGNN